MYRTTSIAITSLLLSCASSDFTKQCTLEPGQQTKALDNIRTFMREAPDIHYQYYLDGPLNLQATYNSRKHCTFVIRPRQPISTPFAWDGTWAMRVDKTTLEVDKHYRMDVK